MVRFRLWCLTVTVWTRRSAAQSRYSFVSFTVYVWAAPEQGAQLTGVSADLLSIQRRILWTPELKVKQDVQNESSCEPSWLTVRFQSRSSRESSSVVVCLKRHYRTSMFPSVSNNEALRSQVKLRVGNKTPKPTFLQIGPLNAKVGTSCLCSATNEPELNFTFRWFWFIWTGVQIHLHEANRLDVRATSD